MPDGWLDGDGYPTEAALKGIKRWLVDTSGARRDLMDFVKALWWMPDWGWQEFADKDATVYVLHTGGWSGNESLIGALRENFLWWAMSWQASRIGGHFEFRIKREVTDD